MCWRRRGEEGGGGGGIDCFVANAKPKHNPFVLFCCFCCYCCCCFLLFRRERVSHMLGQSARGGSRTRRRGGGLHTLTCIWLGGGARALGQPLTIHPLSPVRDNPSRASPRFLLSLSFSTLTSLTIRRGKKKQTNWNSAMHYRGWGAGTLVKKQRGKGGEVGWGWGGGEKMWPRGVGRGGPHVQPGARGVVFLPRSLSLSLPPLSDSARARWARARVGAASGNAQGRTRRQEDREGEARRIGGPETSFVRHETRGQREGNKDNGGGEGWVGWGWGWVGGWVGGWMGGGAACTDGVYKKKTSALGVEVEDRIGRHGHTHPPISSLT